ncbi:MAG: transcription elongation factor GreA [Acholeplasmatales bacterium]|nr:transcription elongation factor GreA [Acholeplasmatales bacterium]
MAEKKIIEITEEGYAAVLAEYQNLKDVLIPANIQALQDARSQGDLSENADYDAARDEQARLNARSLELENIIKNHKIIEVDKSKKVSIGKNVNITYVDLGKTFDFAIVGTIEADPINGKISSESPLGKALMGAKKGDTVTVVSESGKESRVLINSVSNK